jgi:chemotaxis signal transduction protein
MQFPVAPSITPAAAAPSDRLRQLLPQLFEADTRSGEAFLRLQVTADTTMALPLDCIEETQLLAPPDITPMPNMPHHLLGLMRVKGQVLWLASLAHFLGLATAVERVYRYETIVMRMTPPAQLGSDSESDLFFGLAVNKIKGSMRLDADRIEPIGAHVRADLVPFLAGQVQHDQETILILNPAALSDIRHHQFTALVST